MSSRSLEDLVIWQAAREIAVEVYRETGCERLDRDAPLRTEVRSAARAVMVTIAAAYEADSAGALARGFDRAGHAITNLSSLLHLTSDLEMLDRPKAAGLLARARELTRLVRGWQRAIRAHQEARKITVSRVN